MTPLGANQTYTDEELGLAPPQLDTAPVTGPQPLGYFQRFLGELGNQQFAPQPGNTGQSFAAGLLSGLGGAGSRIQATQAKLEAQSAQRQAARDKANLEATQEYRKTKASAIKDRRVFDQTHTTLSQAEIDAAPKGSALARLSAGSYPTATLADIKARAPEGETPVAVEGPNGPVYVARSQAIGRRPASIATTGSSTDDAKFIADAIEQGNQAPDTRGLYRMAAPVKAELQRRGYDMMSANKDWLATQRTIATMNGPQQTRLRQAAETAYHSLDIIDELNDNLAMLLQRTKFPRLNRAALAYAKSGAAGEEAASAARQLEAELTDVTSELGNVYMGGNSPTDHALQLASQNLSSDWSQKTLHDATMLARRNLQIRRNSIANSTPLVPGASPAQGAIARPPLSSFNRP